MGKTTILLLGALTLTGCEAVHQHVPGLVRAAPNCPDINFPIYFATGSTTLTPPAAQAIKTASDQSRGCHAALINVTGLADADGGAQRNEALARQRADAVAAALAAQGFPRPVFDIESAGSAGARTDRGAVAPVRRRVEVLIQFKH